MDQPCRVVLYGQSLSLAAVGVGLSRWPELSVCRVNTNDPNVAEHLAQLHPDVILVDLGVTTPAAILAILGRFPRMLLLGINLDNQQVLVLCGQQPLVRTAADLVTLIENHLKSVR